MQKKINEKTIEELRGYAYGRPYELVKKRFRISEKQYFCLKNGKAQGEKLEITTDEQRWFWMNTLLNCARVLSGKCPRSWEENPYLEAAAGGDAHD